jgi:hypothetical protein
MLVHNITADGETAAPLSPLPTSSVLKSQLALPQQLHLNIYLCIAVFPVSFHFQLLIVEQTLPDTTHTSKSANIRPLPRSKCPSSIDWQTRLVDMEAGILTPVAQ